MYLIPWSTTHAQEIANRHAKALKGDFYCTIHYLGAITCVSKFPYHCVITLWQLSDTGNGWQAVLPLQYRPTAKYRTNTVAQYCLITAVSSRLLVEISIRPQLGSPPRQISNLQNRVVTWWWCNTDISLLLAHKHVRQDWFRLSGHSLCKHT